MIIVEDFAKHIKDIRCWITHFYEEDDVQEIIKIRALQRCMNFLIRIFKVIWVDYFFDRPDLIGEMNNFKDHAASQIQS